MLLSPNSTSVFYNMPPDEKMRRLLDVLTTKVGHKLQVEKSRCDGASFHLIMLIRLGGGLRLSSGGYVIK